MVHMCKMIISPGIFFPIFQNFDFLGCHGGGGGVKGLKNGPKQQKIMSVVPYISKTIYHMIFIYGTHV